MNLPTSSADRARALLREFDVGREQFLASLEELSANPPAKLLTWLDGYFASKANGRQFKRKPSMRFRTVFEERQVDVQPKWRNLGTRRERQVELIPGELHFQINAFSPAHKAYRWVLMLKREASGRFSYAGLCGGHRSGLEEVARLRRFFDAATVDLGGTLRAGAEGRCCFCGKLLTDPVSITRGIGPECWRGFLGFSAVQPSLSMPQEGGE